MGKYLYTVLLIALGLNFCTAQQPNLSHWQNIEQAIRNRKLLDQALENVAQEKKAAIQSGWDVNLARAYYYEMLIKDVKTEDSLYFRNSAFMDSLLLSSRSSAVLKAVTHLMQAKRVSLFKRKYLKFNRSTYEKKDLANNYAALSNVQLDSVVRFHFQQAEALAKKMTLSISEEINWLLPGVDGLLFRANLHDLAMLAWIGFEINEDPLALSEKQFIAFLNEDSISFSVALTTYVQHGDGQSGGLKYYLKWLNSYPPHDEKYEHIEFLAKYYLFTKLPHSEMLLTAWQSYLSKSMRSPYETLRANAAYHQFLLYFEQGSKYSQKFEDKYKGQLQQAVRLYQKFEHDIKPYPILQNSLSDLLEKIRAQELKIDVQDTHIPGEPMLLTARYRNIPHIYIKIVKLDFDETLPQGNQEKLTYLMAKKGRLDSSFVLPVAEDDFDKHAAYLKLEGQPAGRYALVFSSQPWGGNPKMTDFVFFTSSRIAAVNTHNKILAVDRKTGLPLKDLKIMAIYKKGSPIRKNFSADGNGFVNPGEREADRFILSKHGDTLEHSFSMEQVKLPNEIYNKDDYDDLDEYYDDHLSLKVYLDRGIYRPGQKVFYKVILLNRDPKDGKLNIFTPKNPYFKKWFGENKPKLLLCDAKNRKIDSISLSADHYGSFSGTFTIPKTALLGTWNIMCNVLSGYGDDLDFQVEEYKRPSFEMAMEKPVETSLPGQPFELRLKVRSLSGAQLAQVKVSYRLERGGELPKEKNGSKTETALNTYPRYTKQHLLSGAQYTNEKGELVIAVQDTALARQVLDQYREWKFQYFLYANATEATGEQINLEDNYSISSWPVKITIPTTKAYNRKDLNEFKLMSHAENPIYSPDHLEVKLYRLVKVTDSIMQKKVDQSIYTQQQLRQWFPQLKFGQEQPKVVEQLLATNQIGAKEAKYSPVTDQMTTGRYKLVVLSKLNGKITGKAETNFEVFDTELNQLPGDETNFDYMPFNTVAAGGQLDYYSGTITDGHILYGLTYYVKGKKQLGTKTIYVFRKEHKGLQRYTFKIPNEATNHAVLSKLYVHDNKVYLQEKQIYLQQPMSESPEIIVEKYRKVLSPGAKETFSISVKTGNKKIAAQLMTTMYDAALDQLAPHSLEAPSYRNYGQYIRHDWSSSLSRTNSVVMASLNSPINEYYFEDSIMMIGGHVPGVLASNTELNEVALVSSSVRAVAGLASVITIRGQSSLASYGETLVVIDGIIYTGDLKSLDPSMIQDIMVLKGADATALYGARAANGVLLISTNGKVQLQQEPEPQIVIRKDFNETAFFYPAIYADREGNYSFSFTMPQSATAWNWKMLAHTRNGLFAYAMRKINTRLNLMVQPHLPRLLYQGDELMLRSRVSNLDSLPIKAKLSLKVEDAVTGEDLTLKLLPTGSSKLLALAAGQTVADGFRLIVPAQQLNPLKLVVSVNGGGLADAEEHVLPIYPKRIFVRKQQPFTLSKADTLMKAVVLPADAESYGMGLYINPKPQAALIYALPYLANYPFNCAEQTFNKLMAHVTAKRLMKTDVQLAHLFAQVRQQDTRDTSAKVPLLDEQATAAMPWLTMADRTGQQQKLLYQLLDTTANEAKLVQYLQKLYQLQQPDGGLPWFEGGRTNRWISNYLIRGFGKLQQQGWNAPKQADYHKFMSKLTTYADSAKTAQDMLYYAYARSFTMADYCISQANMEQIQAQLALTAKTVDKENLYTQCLWLYVVKAYIGRAQPLYTKAEELVASILQRAIRDENHGLRWKEIADNDRLSQSKEENIALLYEVFKQWNVDGRVAGDLLKWILTTKQEYNWQTTTGTAEAIAMLQNGTENNSAFQPDTVAAHVNGLHMSVSNNLLSGNNFKFIPLIQPTDIPLLASANRPLQGGLTWFYFTAGEQLSALNAEVKLGKKLYRYHQEQASWLALTDGQVLKIGDQVKVELQIETQRPLSFVQLSDKRSAAFEPADTESGQKYVNGISYYQSVRDTGVELFAEHIPAGRSTVSYSLKVSQEGLFTNGPAILQGMYNPIISAYSNTMKVSVGSR